MPPDDTTFAFRGTIIHSLSLTQLEILPDALITISGSTGRIISLDRTPRDPPPGADEGHAVTLLRPGQFLIPGLVDTHNHAPQWPQRGLGQGMHILDWLSAVTFPSEARYADAAFAARQHARLLDGTLRQGVTTACYYSSVHGDATRILASLCLQRGQRALVGKCNMNRNSPDYYRDQSAQESLEETERCIAHIRSIDPEGDLVRPILTPRFAISCDADLLAGLGDMAVKDPSLAIQTHFNEARQEIDATLALFPDFTNEVDLYSHFNLLTPRSILAHCTCMAGDETQRLAALGCGVAHCPTANMTVGGGFMAAPVRRFLDHGLRVGLGTDSGGGFSSSLLDAMRHALIASFAREASTDGAERGLTLEEVFYLATVGGAQVAGWGDEVGNFEAGKQFDAVLVDVRDERGGVNAPMEDTDTPKLMFDKFVMTGDDRNVTQVFVRGRKVHSTE